MGWVHAYNEHGAEALSYQRTGGRPLCPDMPPHWASRSVPRRLRAELPTGKLILPWDGAPYHRAKTVWSAAASLNITLLPLPGYSPDLMAVEPLWRWLREDVTYHHCHATAENLVRRVPAFEANVNAEPCAVAGCFWVKDHLDPEEEKLRFSK